ncbi:Hsp20/alpha crystallin family protein [Actinoallomurus rhizosphaericola]|uniref:Hsp20/alpha crystallin family protein n=1 Tax=Actinoallomurus rhizosphaericola TaxID=2952536 RepID=UPI002093B53D|nr:Hsp20 family protein [Actinoallomurus rhizosphaericola]MCO5998042.1 Hsp20 family protein [Actinoallomurus rhizosphaericola]
MEPTGLLHRDPFADVQELLNRMTGLIQPPMEAEAERPWVPIAEIDETDDGYVVRLELPGILPDDIDVGIRDRELCVNGEVREETEGSNALRVRVGRFHYHASLPSDVDEDNVEAKLEEGVLTLRIPKAQRSHGHRVPITGGRTTGTPLGGAETTGTPAEGMGTTGMPAEGQATGMPAGGTHTGGMPATGATESGGMPSEGIRPER